MLDDSIPFKGSNIITFVFVASFDVYEFFKKDVGERNVAEFLGALGMNTAKLFIAGALTAIALSLIALALSSYEVVISGGLLLITIAGVSFLAGWFVDSVDSYLGIKDKVKSFLKEAFPNVNLEYKKELDESEIYRRTYYNPQIMTTKWF